MRRGQRRDRRRCESLSGVCDTVKATANRVQIGVMRQAVALLTGGAPLTHASCHNTYDVRICDSACSNERSHDHVSPGTSAEPRARPSARAQIVRRDTAGALLSPPRLLCLESWQHQRQVRPSRPPHWRTSRPDRPCKDWAGQQRRGIPGAAQPPPRLPRMASAPRQSSSLGDLALPLHRANSSPSCSAVICCPAHRQSKFIRHGVHSGKDYWFIIYI